MTSTPPSPLSRNSPSIPPSAQDMHPIVSQIIPHASAIAGLMFLREGYLDLATALPRPFSTLSFIAIRFSSGYRLRTESHVHTNLDLLAAQTNFFALLNDKRLHSCNPHHRNRNYHLLLAVFPPPFGSPMVAKTAILQAEQKTRRGRRKPPSRSLGDLKGRSSGGIYTAGLTTP